MYRGHYDILYKIGDLYKIDDVPNVNPQVQNMSYAPIYGQPNSFYSHALHQTPIYLPGLSLCGISSRGILTSIPTPYSHDIYPSAFTSHGLHHQPPFSEPYAVSNYPPVQSPPRPSAIVQSPPTETNMHDSFRHSKFQLEPGYHDLRTAPLEPCQTDAMLSAGAHISHYQNEDFQPQLWEPDSEYGSGRETASQNRRDS